MSKTLIVVRREYMERVGKKSFIITTIVMPIVMLALCVLPALFMVLAGPSESRVMVLDRSMDILPHMTDTEQVKFVPSILPLDSALTVQDVDAVLVIPANVVKAHDARLQLYSNGPSAMETEAAITKQINKIIEDQRLEALDMADIHKILDSVHSDIAMATFRNDKGQEESISGSVSFGIGIAMAVLLEIFLTIYGSMIMNSIIEEKGNRVLELVVSSIKPAQLMMGKIIGVTLVAVTQILIWGVILIALSAFVLPMVMSPSFIAGAQASGNGEIAEAMQMFGSVGFILKQISMLVLFLVAGFLFYSSLFAAVGSSVDNLQDASQLQMVTLVPITIGIVVAMTVAADPTSALAMWTSFIPFTSPMVVMARIPFDIPAWQIWVSLAILILSFIVTVRIVGKIYRVGIFMYGKKPTVREILRWINYK